MSEFHSLANLIKRLEVATTRLEDLAMSSSSASAVAVSSSNKGQTPAQQQQQQQPLSSSSETPLAVQKHDDAIANALQTFQKLSLEIGGSVAEQVK